MASRFSKRSTQEEIMDDLSCSGEVVDQTLRELDSINVLLGGNNATLNGVAQLLNGNTEREIQLVDLGCGSGKMLRIIAKKFRSYNISMLGIDANESIVQYARKNNAEPNITFETENVLAQSFRNREIDIAVATLFLHHFTNVELIQLLRSLASQCRIGVVINDLHRHWFAYHSIKILTKIFSRSSMVKFDAPVSVLRGFKKPEVHSILKAAGITNYTLRWKWAFRWQIVISTS